MSILPIIAPFLISQAAPPQVDQKQIHIAIEKGLHILEAGAGIIPRIASASVATIRHCQ